MTFANAIKVSNDEAMTTTTNGMVARKTSADQVLDLFGSIGASRGQDLSVKFLAALNDDEDLTLRVLMWARDVRGGAGERQQFRNLVQTLEKSRPAVAARLIAKIPEIGRWDDLFVFQNFENRQRAFALIRDALFEGQKAKNDLDLLDSMSEEEAQKLLDSYTAQNGISS